ncbi:MAG: D-alanyl-D-alanine carboxypeptidase/D-alanyl-D-alanine-endopeptidase, partial [Planctomycetes bacterium]|nr:D-alanyl-D-alanine carboxypeptidase/D-alanyl-D-alanine-endopeptidase [Planctomycetota bacterium]
LVLLVLLVLLLFGCATHSQRVGQDRLHDDIAAACAGKVVVSVLAVSLDDGRTVFARQPELLMRPASTMKLLTTATLCVRRPDLELLTALEARDTDGGALRLVGGADPLLSGQDLSDLVARIHREGVRHVTVLAYVDPLSGQPRFGQGWMWDDEPGAFMPHLSGLTVDGGTVEIVARGTRTGVAAAYSPKSAHTPIVVRPAKGPLQITRDWRAGKSTVTITGSLPVGAERRRTLSVPDSARHTAEVLKQLLVDAGIAGRDLLVRTAGDADRWQARHRVEQRHSLPSLLEKANKASDNLTAEMLLRHLGATEGMTIGTVASGHAVVRDHLAALGIPEKGYRLADGSGVSHYNLVSADLLVRLLSAASRAGNPSRDLLLDSLAVAGKDGTLATRMGGTAAEGVVRAKTGTVSAVSTLAGYLVTADGEPLAFAILCQNFVGSASPWRTLQDRICLALIAGQGPWENTRLRSSLHADPLDNESGNGAPPRRERRP